MQTLNTPSALAVHEHTFASSPASVGLARDAVRRVMAARGADEDAAAGALLVASELVTNSLRLLPPAVPLRMRVVEEPARVVIQVWDPAADIDPAPRADDWDLAAVDALDDDGEGDLPHVGGWGLLLAAAHAGARGIIRDPAGGKWVWSAIDLITPPTE